MTAEELRLELSNIVSSLDDSEIISMWNEIANGDNWIYSNDEYELDTVFDGQKPSDIIRTIFFGDYRYNDNYFCFNGYANLDSFDYVDDKNSPYDEDMLIDYIIENEESFGNDEIQELLDEFSVEDEEDEEDEEIF